MYYQGNALKKRKSRFWLGVIGICIVILSAWLIEAWGHDTPKIRNGTETHMLSQQWPDGGEDLHWHEDADGRGAGAWDQCVADAYDPDTDSYNLRGGRCAEESLPSPPPPTTPTPRPTTPRPRTNPTPSASAVIELPDPDEQPAPPDDTSMIDNPVEAVVETEPVELVYHEWTWLKGYNLVSFPVMREGIETVADLYQEYALFNAPQDIIYVAIDGCWFAYNGQEGQVAGEVRITPYLGVVMVMDWTAILGMRGVEQIGDGELELMPGLNVVGLPELPSRYGKPSDFLEVDGIEVVMATAWNDETKMSDIHVIGRAGDPGDNPLYRGQAVILIATTQLTLDLSNDVASAPGIHRRLITGWGTMKQ